MLGFVSQSIDIVQRSLPAPEVLVLEAVEQFELDIVFRGRSWGTPRCPSRGAREIVKSVIREVDEIGSTLSTSCEPLQPGRSVQFQAIQEFRARERAQSSYCRCRLCQ
jgi:hypothetical protein